MIFLGGRGREPFIKLASELLLLLRHNIMKKMGKRSQGVALGWLEDQVRAPGEFIDAAHIDEKLSKRCVERRRM